MLPDYTKFFSIMDTAKRVAELEHRLVEQEDLNHDLVRELGLETERRQDLEIELLDLDHLQNQFDDGSGGKQRNDDDEIIVRDIECQTDASHLVLSPPPEVAILSVLNRLTYSKVVINTLQETIYHLEADVQSLSDKNSRILDNQFENSLELERMYAVSSRSKRIIEELRRRVEGLESDKTAFHLSRTVSVLASVSSNISPQPSFTKRVSSQPRGFPQPINLDRGSSQPSFLERPNSVSSSILSKSSRRSNKRKSLISTVPETPYRNSLIEAPVVGTRKGKRESRYEVSPWDFDQREK
jgi:hypothetical protein